MASKLKHIFEYHNRNPFFSLTMLSFPGDPNFMQLMRDNVCKSGRCRRKTDMCTESSASSARNTGSIPGPIRPSTQQHIVFEIPGCSFKVTITASSAPRQSCQASKEDYTHTHVGEPDAVSTTRFAPQSIEAALVNFPLASHLKAALSPQITTSKRHNSGIAQHHSLRTTSWSSKFPAGRTPYIPRWQLDSNGG
jgi:hypothetical protein